MEWWSMAGLTMVSLGVLTGGALMFRRSVAIGLASLILLASAGTAIVITAGATSLLPAALFLCMGLFLAWPHLSKTDPYRWEVVTSFGITTVLWFAINAWFYTPLGGLQYGRTLQDASSYSVIADYLVTHGLERVPVVPDRAIPYHYLDIWIAVLLHILTGINPNWLFPLVVSPIMTGAVAALIYQLSRSAGATIGQSTVLVLVGLIGVVVPGPILSWLNSTLIFGGTKDLYLVLPHHFKLLSASLMILTAIFVARWSVLGAIVVFGSVHFVYGSIAPVATCASLLLCAYWHWKGTARTAWLWIAAVAPALLWLVWYWKFLMGTLGLAAAPFSMQTAINIVGRTGIHMSVMVGVVCLLFWKLIWQYRIKAFGWLLVAIAGLPVWALTYRSLDSVQAFSNPYTLAWQMGLLGLGLTIISKHNRLWWRFVIWLGLVSLLHIGWTLFLDRKPNDTYSVSYRNALSPVGNDTAVRVAVFEPVQPNQPLWNKHQYFINYPIFGWQPYFVSLISVSGSAIQLSQNDAVAASQEIRLIAQLPFQQYWQQSKLPEATARFEFIRSKGIRHLVVRGPNAPPAGLPLRLLAQDSVSKDQFYAVIY